MSRHEDFDPNRRGALKCLAWAGTGVVWTLVGWGVLGLPLPKYLGPRVHARADDRDGGYRFSVAVLHPWVGLLFAYRGELVVGLIDRPQ